MPSSLEKRYLAKNAEGKVVETPETMFERVSCAIAQAEEKYADKNQSLAKNSMT